MQLLIILIEKVVIGDGLQQLGKVDLNAGHAYIDLRRWIWAPFPCGVLMQPLLGFHQDVAAVIFLFVLLGFASRAPYLLSLAELCRALFG